MDCAAPLGSQGYNDPDSDRLALGETGFTGILEKVDTATGTLVVQGVTVRLASGAVIRAGDKDIRLSDLKTGDKVKVAGTKQADGTFLATRIEVATPPPPTTANAAFDGAIEKIAADGKSIVVRGITVMISDKTVIQSAGKAIKVTDLKLGDKVKVAGTKQADGTFLAQQIVVIPATPVPAETAFEGAVEKIAADGRSIVVGGITVLISEKTVIQSGSRTIKVADLKVGDRVKVKGQKQSNGNFLAALVFVLSPATAK